MEGQIGNKDVATAASMKRLLPHEHKPLGQNESGASDTAEASELTRVGEESVRDVILPRGAMPDEKRGVQRIIVFSGDLGRTVLSQFSWFCPQGKRLIQLCRFYLADEFSTNTFLLN